MTERAARGITPSQTVGPFFAFALTPTAYSHAPLTSNDLRTPGAVGTPIRLEGVLYDGAGQPVPDALVEIWQADGRGHYPGSDGVAVPEGAFKGFGRSECDQAGRYTFATVKPGAAAGEGGVGPLQAPHVNVGIFARGLLRRLFTRIYFEDESGNGVDPILLLVPEGLRSTLIARRRRGGAEGEGKDRDGLPTYVLDIHLQGEHETVFFDA